MERHQRGSLSPRKERLQGVLRSLDGTTPGLGVIRSLDGTTQGGRSVLGGTTPGVSFSLRLERLQGGPSVLGWNNSRGVIRS